MCGKAQAYPPVEYPGVEKAPSGRISPERSGSIPTHPGKVAGIGSERRPNSPRNGGRIHVGTVAGLASEWWPDCVGIRTQPEISVVSTEEEPIDDRIMSKRKSPRTVNWRLRFLVMKRDHFRCKFCGAPSGPNVELHVDHIVPYSKGGETDFENLQTLCDKCNIGKSDLV